ncbi:hypothetical protein [Clostridium sporogenes]|uniref:hypothetical protein n=1 Tax=Clostridium sporogenes TaxID=1509 RepID=UPI00024BA62A|nr:hypothetical protein [Clostridium sporogenes]EHN17044.1 hypothetical protein IYC_00662 [Clostridium sporogenes PA 3679]NFQ35226.1 hypothetical protein [Clostridium sporogenes]NFQ60596.1 hypothetical protein [Clostridium sporogenes]NFU11157.1 hypothetical protein [Clostridium sporogenes]NFU43893.1 hypothetical protein [Clostridium sporogenes]
MNSYKDLMKLIEIHEEILDSYKESLSKINGFLLYSGAPEGYKKGTSYVDADCIHGGKKFLHPDMMENLAYGTEEIKNMISKEEDILKGLYITRKNIKHKLNGLTGIEHKVAYLKEVEGYNLIQVACKLGKSYDYIKEISSKIKKYRENTISHF